MFSEHGESKPPELSRELANTYLAFQLVRTVGLSLFFSGISMGIFGIDRNAGAVLSLIGFLGVLAVTVGAYVVAWSPDNREEYLHKEHDQGSLAGMGAGVVNLPDLD